MNSNHYFNHFASRKHFMKMNPTWKYIFILSLCVPLSVSTKVRLYGVNGTAGIVEILVTGDKWGTICDDQWDDDDARVVCRELGMPGGTAVRKAPDRFGLRWQTDSRLRNAPIDRLDVLCTGSEISVLECPHSTMGDSIYGGGVSQCDHSEDAGVVCSSIVEQTTTPSQQTNADDSFTKYNLGDTNGGFVNVDDININQDGGTDSQADAKSQKNHGTKQQQTLAVSSAVDTGITTLLWSNILVVVAVYFSM